MVARRNLAGGPWQEQRVVVGANGGSFATTWHISQSSLFVAQWSGDSGRPGQGSQVLTVTVKEEVAKAIAGGDEPLPVTRAALTRPIPRARLAHRRGPL